MGYSKVYIYIVMKCTMVRYMMEYKYNKVKGIYITLVLDMIEYIE